MRPKQINRRIYYQRVNFITQYFGFGNSQPQINESFLTSNFDDFSSKEWNQYFKYLSENYKKLTVDDTIKILYKVVKFSKDPNVKIDKSPGLKLLIQNHPTLVEYMIHKLNIHFKETGEYHLQLFTMIGYMNHEANSEGNTVENNLSDKTKLEIFRIYNRCRRVLTKGTPDYFVEIFKQNAPLRENILSSTTQSKPDSKPNQLFKICEFLLKHLFMNPFTTNIEKTLPLKIHYHPNTCLSCI